jgi:hypothetical protein
VAVDPTGQFVYVANFQNVSSLSGYSIGPSGALTPIAGSPFATGAQPISVAFTPKVPFASFFAKLKIKERHRPSFELKEFFTLGTNSNGIDPVTENTTLQVGPFSVTIPADSFEKVPMEDSNLRGSSTTSAWRCKLSQSAITFLHSLPTAKAWI